MASWTCPACGTVNAQDAPECSSCGRWPSVFDLERRPDGEAAGDLAGRTVEAPPVVTAPVPEEVWVDIEGEAPVAAAPPELETAEDGDEQPARQGAIVRLLVWAVVIGAVVIPWLLDAIRG
jgi:hypothetical protein